MDNVEKSELSAFAVALLERAGADRGEAESVARALLWADLAGRPNQGVWRIPAIIRKIEGGGIVSPCSPSVESLSESCALIDGHDGIGYYLAEFAIEHGIALAEATGIAFVGVRNSNHCGALGYFVQRAARRGCVALAFSNSFPRVAPHGGKSPALGTNPLAIGAPAADKRDFVLDMSTSTQSSSAVTRLAESVGTVPPGIAIAADGGPTTQAAEAIKGSMLPLGGAKGFGLAVAVEILAGILTGAAVSHEIQSLYEHESAGRNGQSFIVIKIDRFMSVEAFHSRLADLRRLVGADHPGVRLAGDRVADAQARATIDGIPIDHATRGRLAELAERFGLGAPFPGKS